MGGFGWPGRGYNSEGPFHSGGGATRIPCRIGVSTRVEGLDEDVRATATVIVVDVTPPGSPGPEQLARVAIFPERVVLSPGESTRVSIVGLNGDIQSMSGANVRWSLNPPEVGEVSQFVNVTAHDFPGVYEGAIRAEVTLETENGPVIQEVSATLVIRDKLTTVEVTPPVAAVARGERMQFRAVAYDANGVLLSDVFFRWSMGDSAAGSIDANGLFAAKGTVGRYSGAVQVEAIQHRRTLR